MPPEEFNVLLKKLLHRIAVTKDEVLIEPWAGVSWVYDRH
jgi:hypothetical protein